MQRERNGKFFCRSRPFSYSTAPRSGVDGYPMDSKFSIPANDAQAYSLMRTYGISDEELKDFISNMLSEIKVLADYAKLSDVSGHARAALAALEATKTRSS